jgi:hypothetical protein
MGFDIKNNMTTPGLSRFEDVRVALVTKGFSCGYFYDTNDPGFLFYMDAFSGQEVVVVFSEGETHPLVIHKVDWGQSHFDNPDGYYLLVDLTSKVHMTIQIGEED